MLEQLEYRDPQRVQFDIFYEEHCRNEGRQHAESALDGMVDGILHGKFPPVLHEVDLSPRELYRKARFFKKLRDWGVVRVGPTIVGEGDMPDGFSIIVMPPTETEEKHIELRFGLDEVALLNSPTSDVELLPFDFHKFNRESAQATFIDGIFAAVDIASRSARTYHELRRQANALIV